MKSISSLTLLGALLGAPAAFSQEAPFASLIITEVQPSTGQVEVTNLSEETVTTSRLPFCHRFNYGATVPSGTVFGPGESVVFTIRGLSAANSDLWLYRSGGFGNAANLISGLNWGAGLQGRTNLASGAQLWDGLTLAAPPADQSLQLTPGADHRLSTSWITSAPNLGEFSHVQAAPPNQATPENVSLRLIDGNVALSWEGGQPPYQVFESTDLVNFSRVGRRTDLLSVALPRRETTSGARFYRVEGAAGPAPQARFEATVTSLWSNLTFAMAPSNAGFESLSATTHAASADFWEAGQAPSNGLRILTASNQSVLLQNEFLSAGAEPIEITGDVRVADTVTFTIEAELEEAQFTFLARLAGMSPVLFTGIDGFSLRDAEGNWIEETELALQPWSAGETITSLRNQGPFGPSFFLRQAGEDAPPLGTIQLRRID